MDYVFCLSFQKLECVVHLRMVNASQRFKVIHLMENNPPKQKTDKLIEKIGNFFAVVLMLISSSRTTRFSKLRHWRTKSLKNNC